MPFVTVEIDIAADGSLRAIPNPVRVRSGQTLFFHLNRNASELTKFTISFPGGPQSPFGSRANTVEVAAQPCLGGGSHVNWPPGVRRATVTVSAHGSPVLGTIDVEVLNDDFIGVLPTPGAPQIVQHSYLGNAAPSAVPVSVPPVALNPLAAPIGGDNVGGVTPKSTDCGPEEVSAGPLWGPWDHDENTAIDKALTRVRNACTRQCHGKCSKEGNTCKYLEQKSSIHDIEERQQNNHTEYRAKASSSGKCQCE